ncbi:MAG: hypothetical protein ACFE9R_17775 [Candidatus Hermodarchaeota archaeon]
MKNPIPENLALEICEIVRKRNENKKISFAKGQCWGCMKVSLKKNDVKVRCIFSSPENRGCQLVNKIFDVEYQNLNL